MKVPTACNLVILLLSISGARSSTASSSGFGMLLSADPVITDGVVCANQDVHFTCQMLGVQRVDQYLWSCGKTTLRIGSQTDTCNIPLRSSSINVTCVVHAHVNSRSVSGDINVLFFIGEKPKITFQDVTGNSVYKLIGKPFNLTATVVSLANLELLYWSHQPSMHPPPRNITVNDGNTTTTTIMISEVHFVSNHTLHASNKCGQSSLQIEVLTGDVPQIYFEDVINNFVYKLTRSPFSLTATIVSDLNLTSLYWSTPEGVGPIPNNTEIVCHGDITTTTFTSLKNASLSDSGNYIVTAANGRGQSSSYIDVEFLTDCPAPKFTGVQPRNFIAVEGYNTTLKYSFDGYYSLASPLRIWTLLPHSQTPAWLDEFNYPECGCWVEHQYVCSVGTNNNDCCRFELTVHSIPHVNESGTAFSSTHNFTDGENAWMYVVPKPKVLEPPHNITKTVGSTAVFSCDFEAATDNKITQIHWLFNGGDLAGCSRFQENINCAVTQHVQSIDKNYITSTLTIYPVQADNDGQYTCYCSYNTSLLNVDGVQVIESNHKFATLSVQSGSAPDKNLHTSAIIIGTSVGVFLIIIVLIIMLMLIYKFHHKKYMGYRLVDLSDPLEEEITDEELDQYITEELFPLWEKLGKALKLPGDFLEDIYYKFPEDPAERLRGILREWKAKADHPSVNMLDKRLEKFGFKDLANPRIN